MTKNQERINVIDALRGIAALAVAWFHFTRTQGLDDSLIKASGEYGWLGVDVFFVISGFVIPYALQRADYRLTDYWRFLLKRFFRLEPPYIASIVVIVVIGFLTPLLPGFRGEPFSLSIVQLLLHLGYLNVFFGYPWLNIVYWSLAIEFQYYLLVGLIFPTLNSRKWQLIAGVIIVAALATFLLPSEQFIFRYALLFLSGIVTFRYRSGLINRLELLWLLTLFAGMNYLALGAPEALAGVTTALLIAFVKLQTGPLKFFGTISYSLYLLHIPIGAKVMNFGLRYVQTRGGKLGLIATAMCVTIMASYVFYLLVEKPAQRWSSSVSFGRLKKAQTAEALIDRQPL